MRSSYPPIPYPILTSTTTPTASTSAYTLDTDPSDSDLLIPSEERRQSSPLTPPPTPTSRPSDEFSTPPELMFELTRSKLERAAQGQMTGRRGAPGLRELVLLSNVFSGVARPQWMQTQTQRDDRDLAEIERKQKEDEARWLDGVLEEMLIDGDGWEEEEEFVNVSFRDERGLGDSGYLEAGVSQLAISQPKMGGVGGAEGTFSVDPVLEEDEDEEGDDEEEGSDETVQDRERLGSHSHPPLDPPDPPPSPPLPPRSPPIAVPERSRNPYRHAQVLIDDDEYSSSPPFHLPALTPDCSPPGLGASPDLLGSSYDSLSSSGDLEAQHVRWLDERDAARPGLFSRPRPSRKSFSKSSTESLEMVYPVSRSPSLESFAFGPPSPTLFDSSFPSPSSSSSSLPPFRPSSESLAVVLIKTNPLHAPSSSSPTPPPRSRTSTSSNSVTPAEPAFSSFKGGIVKSFYDAVDFGGSPRPQLPATCGDLPMYLDLSSSELRAPSRNKAIDQTRGRDDLALVFRPNPLSPGLGFGASQGWRSRSLSPEENGGGKRQWARLSNVVDSVDVEED